MTSSPDWSYPKRADPDAKNPCGKYGPDHYLYTRGSKKFCRSNWDRPQVKGKIAIKGSCDKYEPPEHILYRRNNRVWCRRKIPGRGRKAVSRKRAVTPVTSPTIAKKFLPACLEAGKKTVKNWGKVTNLDSELWEPIEICEALQDVHFLPNPTLLQTKRIARVLEVPVPKKVTQAQLAKKVADKLLAHSTKDFQELLQLFLHSEDITGLPETIINKLLFFILYPQDLTFESPIPVTEDLYEQLIYRRRNEQPISDDDKKLLDQSLWIKMCHCIINVILSDKLRADALGKGPKVRDPRGMCDQSIYRRRNWQAPKHSPPCQALDWYRRLGYLSSGTQKKK